MRARYLVVASLLPLGLGITACNLFDPDKHKGPTAPEDAPLVLSTPGGANSLPADGFSTLEITAKISPDAVKSNRKISFTTTGGSFVGASSPVTNISIAPDATGTAKALLRSSTEIGSVILTAQVMDGNTAKGSAARAQIDFVEPDSRPVTLSTVGGVTSLPADGLSKVEIEGRIAPEDANRGRKVNFTTTAGTLLASTSSGESIDVTPDGGGLATALLQSSTEVGTVLVTAQMKEGEDLVGGAAQLRLEFVQPDAANIIRFVEIISSAPADGATASRFTVRISSSIDANERTVTFRTTAGSFSATPPATTIDTAMAGADGLASILLYSPVKSTQARISAEVSGFEAHADIDFVPALTERIFVTIDKFTLKQNESAVVKVTLDRRVGFPSEGTVVEPVALDVNDVKFGVFTGDRRSDASGNVTLEFHPGGGGTPGRARVRVTAEGSSAIGEIEFELAPP